MTVIVKAKENQKTVGSNFTIRDLSSSSVDSDVSSSNNGEQHHHHQQQQQPQRNPGWRGWVQGTAFGLIFDTLPMWHLMSEF